MFFEQVMMRATVLHGKLIPQRNLHIMRDASPHD